MCINPDWDFEKAFDLLASRRATGPAAREIVTIRYIQVERGEDYLSLEEYHPNNGYAAKNFRKLYDDTVNRILKEITIQPVELR